MVMMDEISLTQKWINLAYLMGGFFLLSFVLIYCAYGVGWCLAWLMGCRQDKNSINRPGQN